MTPSLAPRDSGNLPAIGMSVGVHALLIGIALWFSHSGGPRIDLTTKPIQAKLVRLGEKRDDKLLPRMEANTPPPPPETKKVVPTTEPVPTPTAQPKPPPTPAAPQRDVKKDLFAAFDKTKPITKAEPQGGSPDGDAEGDSDTAGEGERYYGLISARVRRNYDVSNSIPDSERIRLTATVVLYLDASGKVTKSELSEKSGNDLFDQAVIAAVQKASPFPPPPKALAGPLSSVGVALKFKP